MIDQKQISQHVGKDDPISKEIVILWNGYADAVGAYNRSKSSSDLKRWKTVEKALESALAKYDGAHPDEKLLSQVAYAKKIGVTRQRVAAYIKSGQISKSALVISGKRVLINPDIADSDIAKNVEPTKGGRRKANIPDAKKREIAKSAGLPTDEQDFQASRALNEYYKAALKKIEYEAAEGKLLDAEDVGKRAFDRGRQVRDAILNIPNRICDRLSTMTDRNEINNFLTDELTDVLTVLADRHG